MQQIKNHKIVAIFNLLALLLIIFGMITDFTVPESGTSISGGLVAWGGLLLIFMLFIDGIVVTRRPNNNPGKSLANVVIVPDAQQQKMARMKGISIMLGVLLGVVGAYFFSGAGSNATDGGDMAAGIILIFLAPVFAAFGAFTLFTLASIIFGNKAQKSSAIKWFVIVALLIAAYIGYSYYSAQHEQKYCDGQPIEQYQGELPSYCSNQ